jgi:16S rRNA (uracil1498-N3)-methyltransferase
VPQFFIKESDIDGIKTVIRGDDCHHLINVRRVKTGDLLRLRSDTGKGFTARVSEVGRTEISLVIIEETAAGDETVSISLYMALLKSGNFEFVLQKAVEVGVNRIVPVTSSRTVPDPGKKIDNKHERWSRIISGAAKQCFRNNMPVLELPLAFSDALKNDDSDMKLIAHPGAVTELRDYLSSSERPESVSLLVGPEGGFTETELNSASEKGWVPVNFGTTHLRAETAAVILPSLVIYQWS